MEVPDYPVYYDRDENGVLIVVDGRPSWNKESEKRPPPPSPSELADDPERDRAKRAGLAR